MKWTFCLMLAAALAWGCAHSRRGDYNGGLNASFSQVQAPEFFTGPMSLLLSNAHGFSAHVKFDTGVASRAGATISGELLVRGHMLLFTPAADTTVPKRFRAGSISFIWDAAANHGYVISEALQAYAPISFSVCATNLVLNPTGENSQTIDHHSCDREAAIVSSTDGAMTLFHVWRAQDLNRVPVRITTVTNAVPLTLSFSRVRSVEPLVELFQLPSGFTKYDTAEGMMTELTIRRQNLKRRGTETWGQGETLDSGDMQRQR